MQKAISFENFQTLLIVFESSEPVGFHLSPFIDSDCDLFYALFFRQDARDGPYTINYLYMWHLLKNLSGLFDGLYIYIYNICIYNKPLRRVASVVFALIFIRVLY